MLPHVAHLQVGENSVFSCFPIVFLELEMHRLTELYDIKLHSYVCFAYAEDWKFNFIEPCQSFMVIFLFSAFGLSLIQLTEYLRKYLFLP